MVVQYLSPSRLGPKSQVVVPKLVRDLLGVGPSDEIYWVVKDGTVNVEARTALELLEAALAAYPKTRERKHDWSEELYRRYEK